MNDLALILNNVTRTYHTGSNELPVLKGVNFSVEKGQWCCIYGASGSGKTTLLNLIGALEKPDNGSITVCGQEITSLSRKQAAKYRAKKIGFVFQSFHLLPELNVLENVALAGEISGMSRSDAKKRAQDLIAQVGLTARSSHRPAELSGGEQQRAAIARSLMNSPELLLADEPTGNLDPETGEEILKLFQNLRLTNPDLTILMITHNREIAALATAVVELKHGLLV
ncbi:MAG: ABC transporter ATP-binding protein [Lentisphaerae bacterium]|nr:ABC transporter ATP-binding protein [Lentisphaerota bacterium]